MIRFLLLLTCSLPALAQTPGPAKTDATTVARRAAADFAAAWRNDGFRVRSSHSTGTLEPRKPYVVQVSLLAGNRYWFTAAAPDGGALSLSVHDESGKPLPSEIHEDGPRAAAGFSPETSGTYLVRIAQAGNQSSTFYLIYSYK